MNLAKLRKAIDSIDTRILNLLNERARVILEIGKIKARSNGSVYAPDREVDVYKNVERQNKGPLSRRSLNAIFREIMSASLKLEKALKVAYLGPEFTFTHLAALSKFGSSVSYMGCETITDVFADVEKAKADYGVVPIENSIEGAVNHTFDMFMDSGVKICSEIYLEVSHNLLSRESNIARIRKVYSKREVFGQCRLWLETNLPRAELIEVSSTAKAAGMAAGEKYAACIASELAGKKYRLRVLESAIEDSTHNVTRFLVIGNFEAKQTKEDKTSIMISIKDKVGALHDILIPFKRYGINLTKIESRPSKVRAWEYYFFVDIEGHYRDKKVAKALDELRRNAIHVKILGSYPVGDNT